MLDRLGRQGDETPFVVEWFVKNGIEVWSATEGQQRFDNHVDEAVFDRVAEIMTQRTTKHADVPLNLKGHALLSGKVYCGYCGNRLTLTTSGRKRELKDGSIEREVRARYQCHYNTRHPGECDGQSGCGVTKLDGIVDKIIRLQFAKIRAVSKKALIENQQAKEIECSKAKLKIASDQYEAKQSDLKNSQAETLNVIRGTSRLDIDL